MAVFTCCYRVVGSHVRCSFFATKEPKATWAHCGTLTFRKDEFSAFEMGCPGVTFINLDE